MVRDGVCEIKLMPERPTQAKYLNDCILAGISQGYHKYLVRFEESRTYSNILAPVAGILDFYKEQGYEMHCSFPPDSYVMKTHVDNPFIVDDTAGLRLLNTPLDRVWRFGSSSEINSIVDAVVKYVRQSDIVEKGVIESLEWCINETMDNVLQHSGKDYGFFMAQLQSSHKIFAFCIFDNGRGIFNSFKNSRHKPASRYDAITLAMQERVTRDEKVGQGNGLWGLSEIIHQSNGNMVISSAGAKYYSKNNRVGSVLSGEFNLGRENGTTMIDCQIDYSQMIDIITALHGYEPVDLWLESIEDDQGNYLINIIEQSSGTGTRKAAIPLRNMVMNIVSNEHKKCILDFSGINMISSSYADELIGKIIASIGLVNFMKMFELKNISSYCSSIVNRSVQQRMAQIYYGEEIDESVD